MKSMVQTRGDLIADQQKIPLTTQKRDNGLAIKEIQVKTGQERAVFAKDPGEQLWEQYKSGTDSKETNSIILVARDTSIIISVHC